MSQVVYRIQDGEGRGPYRPGFSDRWVEDREDLDNLVPWIHEFGPVHRYVLSGMSIGCACLKPEQLRRWFTPGEYRTLQGYGYRAVKLQATTILASSDLQCVFARIKPLAEEVEPFDLYS